MAPPPRSAAEELNIPIIPSDRRYWFIRTQDGLYYSAFRHHGIVGIGPSSVSQDLLKAYRNTSKNIVDLKALAVLNPVEERLLSDAIKTLDSLRYLVREEIVKADPEKTKLGASSSASQLLKFFVEVKPDDVVIIPSYKGVDWAFGIVKSEPFWGSEQVLDESVPFPPRAYAKVEWVKQAPKWNVDPSVILKTYGPSAFKELGIVGDAIDRTMFDVYIKSGGISMELQVGDKAVYADDLAEILDIARELHKAHGERVEIKADFASPGFIELVIVGTIGVAALAFFITRLIESNAIGRAGGSTTTSLSVNHPKTGEKLVEMKSETTTPGTIHAKSKRDLDERDMALREKVVDSVLNNNNINLSPGAERLFKAISKKGLNEADPDTDNPRLPEG